MQGAFVGQHAAEVFGDYGAGPNRPHEHSALHRPERAHYPHPHGWLDELEQSDGF